MSLNRGLSLATALALLGTSLASRADEPPMENPVTQGLFAVPGGLTAGEVGKRTSETSLDVLSKREEIRAVAANVDLAFAAFFPRISGVARYTRLSEVAIPSLGSIVVIGDTVPSGQIVPVDPSKTQLLATGLSFPVPLDQGLFQGSISIPISDYFLRGLQGVAAAKASKRAAQEVERAARLKALTDGELLYYAWVRAVATQAVAEQAVAQASAHQIDLRHLFDAGVASHADVLRVDSQVAAAELLATRSRGLVQILDDQLRISMHDRSGRRYQIGEDVLADLPPFAVTSPDDLFAEASTRRLELRALDETTLSLREQSKVTRASYYPRLDAFGDVVAANPNQRIFPLAPEWHTTWDVGVQLSWSPNDVLAAHATAKVTDARAAQVAAQKQQLLDGMRVEVFQAWTGLREAEVALRTAQAGLRAAEESYRARRELFRLGKATSVELTDAEGDLTRSRIEAVNARVDDRVARIKMTHALGRDVDRATN
jgi:outer membrane protein TolC